MFLRYSTFRRGISKNIECHTKAIQTKGKKLFVISIIGNFTSFVQELVADNNSSIRQILRHKNKLLKLFKIIDGVSHYNNNQENPLIVNYLSIIQTSICYQI